MEETNVYLHIEWCVEGRKELHKGEGYYFVCPQSLLVDHYYEIKLKHRSNQCEYLREITLSFPMTTINANVQFYSLIEQFHTLMSNVLL